MELAGLGVGAWIVREVAVLVAMFDIHNKTEYSGRKWARLVVVSSEWGVSWMQLERSG